MELKQEYRISNVNAAELSVITVDVAKEPTAGSIMIDCGPFKRASIQVVDASTGGAIAGNFTLKQGNTKSPSQCVDFSAGAVTVPATGGFVDMIEVSSKWLCLGYPGPGAATGGKVVIYIHMKR